MAKVGADKEKGARIVNGKEIQAPDVTSLIGLKVAGTFDLVAYIKRGLEYNSMEHVIRTANLQREEAIHFVGISAKTLARRKEKGRLSPGRIRPPCSGSTHYQRGAATI